MANIPDLVIPYGDFKLYDVIDPEQHDLNNATIILKINAVKDIVNQIINSAVDGSSGADLISLTPIQGFVSNKLQAFLSEVVSNLKSNNGSLFIGSPSISGLSGTTVLDQLVSLNTIVTSLSSQLTSSISSVNSQISLKANSSDVYTKSELAPYLTGGDTTVYIEVFTVTNANNGNSTFSYQNKAGSAKIGTLSPEGYQVFTLEQSTYVLGINHIKAYVNDSVVKSLASGGLQETATDKVALTTPVANGTEITVEYFHKVGVTGETSIIIGTTTPPLTNTPYTWFKVVG